MAIKERDVMETEQNEIEKDAKETSERIVIVSCGFARRVLTFLVSSTIRMLAPHAACQLSTAL